MKAEQQIRIGSILSYFQMGINIIVTLVYTPLMIRILGKSEYGLYSTVASTISMLSVLSLGFGSGYIKFYAKYDTTEDRVAIAKLNGLMLTIYLIIGSIALLCGLVLTFNLQLVFADGLTSEELQLAKKLMLILSFNIGLSFPTSTFSHIISAHEKFIFLKTIGLLRNVFNPLLNLLLLFYGFGSMGLVIATLAINACVDIIYFYYVLFRLHEKFIFGGYAKGIFISLFSYTGFIAINLIIDQINWNVDKFLLGRYCGTGIVAVYSVGATIYSYYQMFSTAISGLFTPRIHHIINDEHSISVRDKILTNMFTKVGRIQYLILGLILTGFVFFGKEFLVYWVGDGYNESYIVALLLMIPSVIPLIQNLGIEIQRAEDKHRFRSFAYLGMAIINIMLTIVLCKKYGATGAAVGTSISLLVANGFVMNLYYHKQCGINILMFWKTILGASRGIIAPVIFGLLINSCWQTSSFALFACKIMVYTIVYVISVYFFTLTSIDRTKIKNYLSRIGTKVIRR